MRRRAVELETLNRTGHALGKSLEVPQLGLGAARRDRARAAGGHPLEAVVSVGSEPRRFVSDDGGAVRAEPADAEALHWLELDELVLEDRVDDPALGRARAADRAARGVRAFGGRAGRSLARAPRVRPGRAAPAGRDLGTGSDCRAENARLYTLANIERAHGLYCRRYFEIRIAEEIERARRFDSSFALVMLDLDDFKRLNEQPRAPGRRSGAAGGRGHRGQQLRASTLAARYGGEELRSCCRARR